MAGRRKLVQSAAAGDSQGSLDLQTPPKIAKLIEESFAIEEESAREAGQLGFMARALVQATIPHRDPGDVKVWGRENGRVSLTIQQGYVFREGTPQSIGYPFGSIPRLLLAWLSTEAVRTKERQLLLGDTLSEFMGTLGLIPSGGKNGTITRLRDQMQRLFAATIQVTHLSEQGFANRPIQIADETMLWWDPAVPTQAGLWQSHITLSERFFDEVVTTPIPVDMRALKALRQSPMALDIYCWMTYRMSYLRKPTPIPWESLQAQFGADYKEARKFRAKFLEALKKVMLIYDVRIEENNQWLILHPGKPHVPRIKVSGSG